MKRQLSRARLAAALLIGAAAIPATSAFAQETPAQATPDVAPPPVVATVPSAPAPQAAPTMAPAAPIVQQIPQSSLPPTGSDASAPAPRHTTRAATATRTVRSSTATRTTAPTPERAPAAAPQAPAGPAPVARSAAPLPAPQQVPAQPQAPAAAETGTTTQTVRSAPIWPWVAGAIALLALIVGGAMAMRRRRETIETEPYRDTYRDDVRREDESLAVLAVPEPAAAMEDETHLTPLPVAEAVVDTPRIDEPALITPSEAAEASAAEAREHAVIQEPAAEELAGIVDAAAPVDHRPWLEFGIRPVRAGTSHKDAMVEVELIVGNSGDIAAEDVHISTFMLPAGTESEMERLLTHRHEDSVPPVTIPAGEGTKVDAVMSVPREELNGDASFQPIVVADARYTLPDGREGRTSAAFRIGLTDEKGERFEPIGIERPDIFHNVTAQLHGTPEHV